MVDTNILIRQYLLQNSALLALLGPQQITGNVPERFDPLNGPLVTIATEGGNAHPEIPIQTNRVKIRVWAGVDGYQLARQVYGLVHDWLHGKNELDFGDLGTILASIETDTGQDITDPDTGWATVLAYYDVTVRDGNFAELTGYFAQDSQTKAYIDAAVAGGSGGADAVRKTPTADQTIAGPYALILDSSPGLTIHHSGASNGFSHQGLTLYEHTSVGIGGAPTIYILRSGGTESAPTALTNGVSNALGFIFFGGHDGTSYTTGSFCGAFIDATIEGTWSGANHGALLEVFTIPNGAVNAGNVPSLRIRGSGDIEVPRGSLILQTSHTPSSASDTGTAGQIAWDANFIYVCVATNTWKRTALSTW